MNVNTNIFALTKQDTAVLKGIAILAMLMHHLWGCAPSWVEPYTGVLGFLGSVGKVCVAIFLFCSGYGLSVGYSKIVDNTQCTMQGWKYRFVVTLKFLAKRFVKFYAGYWPIFLIFVPLSVFVFGRPLSAAYGEGVNYFKHVLVDLAGVHSFNSYNITWWFNQLIICLYCLFPFLYWFVRKCWWLILMISVTPMVWLGECSFGRIFGVTFWVVPFLLGIICVHKLDRIESLMAFANRNLYFALILMVGMLVELFAIRWYILIPRMNGAEVDGVIAMTLAALIMLCKKYTRYASAIFSFLGKHSINIYLMHTFFILYWPTRMWFVNANRWGGVNLMTLLSLCLIISIGIEWMKKMFGYNKLITIINSKL